MNIKSFLVFFLKTRHKIRVTENLNRAKSYLIELKLPDRAKAT
jgi:REP element-mobilizing transposase RayT